MINEFDVWFSNINISNKKKLELLDKYKTSKNIWSLNEKNLEDFMLDKKQIDCILDVSVRLSLEKYLKYMEKYNIKIVSSISTAYPSSLKHINNRPAFIYIRGNLENLYSDNVSIIGARLASSYGKYVARKIAKEIADKNINIVSGLARGIDKYAHLGALDSKLGKTIAVLGTGVSDNEIYPLENKKLFERILESGGTIVSEFKLGTKPLKYNFPQRNRIISGLSKKIIVVEAKEKSGSLITVEFALEQGKDIYAVPGNITSNNSSGTNKLLKEGAFVFTNVEDLYTL